MRLIAWLSLRLWRVERALRRRRQRRWVLHYRQAIQWHSSKGPIEAGAMAYSRLIDHPASLQECPTTCALADLGHPVEDLT